MSEDTPVSLYKDSPPNGVIDPGLGTPTPAEIEQFGVRLAARLCVVCAVPVEHYEQARCCVYAHPCNHRQYQRRGF
jgi:hypothetical protein